MSSGVEAEVAIDTAVVLGLGMTRVVGGAAGLAAAGAESLASMADARAAERTEALRRAERYEAAIVDVLDVNARVNAVKESIRRARETYGESIDLVVPQPLSPAGQPVERLTEWCAATRAALDAAERDVAAALATAVTGMLFPGHVAGLRTDLGEATTASAATRGEDVEPTGSPAASQPDESCATGAEAAWRAETGSTVARLLSRLLAGATDHDHAHVTGAARQVASASTRSEAEGRLTELRIRIQRANTNTEERRRSAAAAARFLRELDTVAAENADTAETADAETVDADIADIDIADAGSAASAPDAEITAVRAQLADVVAGRGALTERLRDAAVRLLDAAQERAEQRYVVDAITAAFGDMGYEVSEGFETLTARDGDVVLTRGDWPQHAVKLKVDTDSPAARRTRGGTPPAAPLGTPPAAESASPSAAESASPSGSAAVGEVRLAIVRTEPARDADDRRRDVEREREWCDAFDVARERLAEAGIRAKVSHRIEPGAHPIPVDPRSRPGRRRPAARPRERER